MMHMISMLLVMTLAVFHLAGMAQETTDNPDWKLYRTQVKEPPTEDTLIVHDTLPAVHEGTVEIIQDEGITKLLEKHRKLNEKGTISGCRIQLFFGSGAGSRMEAKEVQAEFLKKYPDIPSYLIHEIPNFKVRVGDFRNRLEAEKLKLEIAVDFPNAFIVKDDIKLPPLD